MKGFNQATLVGNVGRAPEIRTTTKGTQMAKWSLATNENRKGDNGVVTEETEWHTCVAFGKLADIVEQYVGQGDRLFVQGKIQYRTVEGGANTPTKYFTDILVDDLVMLDSLKPEEGAVTAEAPAGGDMPF